VLVDRVEQPVAHVQDADAVLEARVRRAGEHEVGRAELLDAAQPLELGVSISETSSRVSSMSPWTGSRSVTVERGIEWARYRGAAGILAPMPPRFVRALVALGLCVHLVLALLDRRESWPAYTRPQWQLLLTAGEDLRIASALGPLWEAYRKVDEHVPKGSWLWVHEGFPRSAYAARVARPTEVAPADREAMLGTFRLRRVLFPTRVVELATDEPDAAAGRSVGAREEWLLDRRPDLPLADARGWEDVAAGPGFVLRRRRR
jgi:hypothetical protein